jgi:hypothetical protein
MYIRTEIEKLEISVYNAYYMNSDKPFVLEVTEESDIMTREFYAYLDAAMNEAERLIGIEIANVIQNHRK